MKDVPGFEGLYAVTRQGKVWSYEKINCIRSHKGKWMTPYTTKEGYARIHLRKDNKKHRILIHRLVATTYIPNYGNKAFVNHKDANKTNNDVANLEWVTHKENAKHAFELGLIQGRPLKRTTF